VSSELIAFFHCSSHIASSYDVGSGRVDKFRAKCLCVPEFPPPLTLPVLSVSADMIIQGKEEDEEKEKESAILICREKEKKE
jgi:hypothetical protein